MSSPPVSGRFALWTLGAVVLLVFGLRLPVILRQIPAQDEDYFAVPGQTILQEGIPRIPYMPSRNPDGAFYRADQMLFTLPPAYFYWEAAWYAALGPSTATARIASLAAGLISLSLLYWLALRWTGSRYAAGLGVVLYGLSRVLMFPCVIARPDMLCGMFGFAALAMTEFWRTDQRARWLVAAGVLIGAGFLTHPFALVYALQAGVWVCLTPATLPRRLGRGALLTATTLAVFSLWGLLIAQHPELFRAQFFNNVLNQAGPGLSSRFVWPWPSLKRQAVLFREHAGTIQAAVMLAGLAGAGLLLALRWRRSRETGDIAAEAAKSETRSGLARLWWLALSGTYLLVVCQGEHPTKGYWCYPGALMFLCAAAVLDALLKGHRRVEPGAVDGRVPAEGRRFGLACVTAAIAIAVMIPGSGIRATAVYLRHWNDIEYDAPRFTAKLLAEVPEGSRLIVDPGYVFDFYRAGRDVRLGLIYGFFYDVRGTPYDYVIGGPYSIRDGVPEAVGAQLIQEVGNRSDPFACSVRIYRSPAAVLAPEPASPRD